MERRKPREFSAQRAVRRGKPVYVGLFGPSGSGKTYSALRIASGIRAHAGGKIVVVDTENGRALDYADLFDFEHIDFQPPFGSLDYVDAFNAAVNLGATIIVADSMSHEHEGEGGMLSFHERELDRLAGNDWAKRERVKMLAWQEPKKARGALRAWVARSPVHLVCCYRAKETAKPVIVNGKTQVVPLGFDPIAGDEFVYEMTTACLLLPASGGVPTWQSDKIGERQMIKLPAQFRDLFTKRGEKPLDEEVGKALAAWASGPAESRAPSVPPSDRVLAAERQAADGARTTEAESPRDELHAEAIDAAREAFKGAGIAKFSDIQRVAEEAGVEGRRVLACWDGEARRLRLERLSTDELTLIVEHIERSPA